MILLNNFGLIVFDIFIGLSNKNISYSQRIKLELYCFRILIIGTAHSWFRQISRRIHIDQILESCAIHCPYLRRLEIQWDPETLRFSENSSKFIDHLRY